MSRLEHYRVSVSCPLPHCEGSGTAVIEVEPEVTSGPPDDWYPGSRGVKAWELDCECAAHPVVNTIAYGMAVCEQALGERPDYDEGDD